MADSGVQAWAWVFVGEGSTMPSGVFSTKDLAVAWIHQDNLTGVLTAYPLDQGVFAWAVANNHFVPKKASQREPAFVQQFSSPKQEHYLFEKGRILSL